MLIHKRMLNASSAQRSTQKCVAVWLGENIRTDGILVCIIITNVRKLTQNLHKLNGKHYRKLCGCGEPLGTKIRTAFTCICVLCFHFAVCCLHKFFFSFFQHLSW